MLSGFRLNGELDGIARMGAEPMLMVTDELEPMADPTYVHKKRDL